MSDFMETDSAMAPSPGQPLNGQGVRGMSRLAGLKDDDIGTDLTIPTEASFNHDRSTEVTDIGVLRTLAMDNAEPSVPTLSPFNPRTRRRKYIPDPTLIHFDHIFGSDHWSRYLTLKTDTKLSMLTLENILLHECPSQEMAFRQINANEWLIETTTKAQSEIYQVLTNIDGFEIKIERHNDLNSIFGTVIIPDDANAENSSGLPNKSILLDSLKLRYNNVEDVEVYFLPNKKKPGFPFKIAKVKFSGQTLPRKIKILGQNKEMHPFVPKPMQCNQCSRFGHIVKRCPNASICAFCSSSAHDTTWNCCDSPRCANCGQDHHARSKTCIFYMYNTELKLLSERTGMSIREAKLELKARGIRDPAKTASYRSKLTIHKDKDDGIGCIAEHDLPIKTLAKSTEDNATIPTFNRFDILLDKDDHMEENNVVDDVESNLDVIQEAKPNVSNKRPRDCNSPPNSKRKSPANSTHTMGSPHLTNPENEEIDCAQVIEVTPSPVIKTKAVSNLLRQKTAVPTENCHNPVDFLASSSVVCGTIQALSQEGISPSPIIGKRKGKLTDPNTIPTMKHNSSCGCHECFHDVVKQQGAGLSHTRLHNIIENFINYRKHNDDSNLEDHPVNCMCVNHLVQKRNSESLKVSTYIANVQQKRTDPLKQQRKSSTPSMLRVDYNKLNRNSSASVPNLTQLS